MENQHGIRQIRVLVVDDEPSNRSLAERILQRAGYVVHALSDGAEALQVDAAEGPFDVYVLDLMMPGMRGTELAARIRATRPDAKILFYTAYDKALFHWKGVLGENEAFVQKPASSRALAEAVSLLLLGHPQGPEGNQ